MPARIFLLTVGASAPAVAATVPSQPAFYKNVLPVLSESLPGMPPPRRSGAHVVPHLHRSTWAKATRLLVGFAPGLPPGILRPG